VVARRTSLADEGGSALRIWNNSHDVKTLCGASLGIREPEDLVADKEGNIFFTDDTAGGLYEVDKERHASVVAGRGKGLFSTEGIALAPSGDILVGDGVRHEVFSVSRDGKISSFLDASRGITKPESMVYDEKGNLYIADNHDDVLYRLTPSMKLERVLEDRPSFSPETIWYANHVLYITDSKHGKLSRYTDEDGLKTIAAFAGKLHNVCGVTTDAEGRLYVSIRTMKTGWAHRQNCRRASRGHASGRLTARLLSRGRHRTAMLVVRCRRAGRTADEIRFKIPVGFRASCAIAIP
jgi:sugar lactone lactonase YvrE